MSEELENKLDEAKATGDDSMSADAVAPAGGEPKKRKGDVKAKVDPKADEIEDDVKTPQGTNNTGLKESAFERIFDGEELSEDFMSKAEAVFEAVINEKTAAIESSLEDKFEKEFVESIESTKQDMIEKVDTYLDYVIESWMEANEVAVESSIKVEVAESLIDSLKGLVESHNIDIDDEQVDAIAELEKRLDESSEKYNEIFEALIEIKEEKETLEREIAFAQISEDLTDTQADKLNVLAEGMSCNSVEDYTSKLKAIKSSYFVENVTVETGAEVLEEETDDEPKAKVLDESIARYAQILDRHAK